MDYRRFQPRYYKLVGTLVVPCGMWDWAETFSEFDNRAVRADEIAGAVVSTVFLGLDHRVYSPRTVDLLEPIVFETMIFPSEVWNFYQTRCSTYEQALAMHQEACGLVRKIQRQLPIVHEEEQ